MTPPAVVFDLDGVLLDSETAWTRAETRLFERYGRTYGADEKRLLIGGSLGETAEELERLLARPGTSEGLLEELLALAAEEFAGPVEPMPGALDLVGELRRTGHPMAVASNSQRRLVDLALDGSGLDQAFDAVVAGDEVAHPKPAPDLYLEACRRLGTAPDSALAIEDSPRGATAARTAGLFVIGIPYLPGLELDADLLAGSLEDAGVRAVLGLRAQADVCEEAEPGLAWEHAALVAVLLDPNGAVLLAEQHRELDPVGLVVRIRIPVPLEVAQTLSSLVVAAVAGPGREPFPNEVRDEQRHSARTEVVECRAHHRAKVVARRHVVDRVVDEDGIEREPQPERAHVALDVLALRVDRSAHRQHLRRHIRQRHLEAALQV